MLLWTLRIAAMTATASAAVVYPSGVYFARYRTGVPFAPEQRVTLTATQPREAHLELSGIFNAQGSISYDRVDDRWVYELSDSISKPLRRGRLELRSLEYDAEVDEPRVEIFIFRLGRVRVTMRRTDTAGGGA